MNCDFCGKPGTLLVTDATRLHSRCAIAVKFLEEADGVTGEFFDALERGSLVPADVLNVLALSDDHGTARAKLTVLIAVRRVLYNGDASQWLQGIEKECLS